MRSTRFDPVAFFAGLISLAFAGAFLFTDYRGFAFIDLQVAVPATLIVLGVIVVIRAMLGARRRT